MNHATLTETKETGKFIDLTKLDIDTLEAFFPSEHPTSNSTSEAEPEARRKAFFKSCRTIETCQ